EVDLRRAVVDVPDVELDPVLPRDGGPSVDLRPAGDARLDLQPASLARRVALHLVRQGRPRPDHAHVPADDVPELGQLVDREPPEDPAGARDPRVALVDRVPGSDLLRPFDHRPHLEQLELDAVLADAVLAVENRAAVLELDRDRRGGDERARQHEPERGEGDVGGAVHDGAWTWTITLSATSTRNGACAEARRSASETCTTARECDG